MDINLIKAEAPEGALYWSTSVEQYFDSNYLNIACKSKGKFIQVDKLYQSELILLVDPE